MTESDHTTPPGGHDDGSSGAPTAAETVRDSSRRAEAESAADCGPVKGPSPPTSAPVPAGTPRSDWWTRLYDDDAAWKDTNSGTPRSGRYIQVSSSRSVVEGPPEEAEETEGEEGNSRPVGSSQARTAKDEEAGEDSLDDPDPVGPAADDADPQEEMEPSARRSWRSSWAWTGEHHGAATAAGAVRELRGLAARRRMGLGYVPAVAAYFSFHLSQHVQPFLTGAVVEPSGMVGSFLALTAMPLVWRLSKALSALPYGAVIRGVATLASGIFLYGPGGRIATAYLSAEGIAPSYWAPFGSGLAAAGLSWWLIDRRIGHLPWPIACALRIPTTTIALSLGQFVLPA